MDESSRRPGRGRGVVRSHGRRLATAVAGGLLLAGPLGPERAGAEGESWRERPGLTGDWRGARSALAERGIAPYAIYTAGFWSNLHGGFETGTRYEGFARLGLDLDLGALAGWQGGSFHLSWHSYHGGQPSSDLVGVAASTFVSGWEGELSYRFYDLYLRQELLDGRVLVRAGQLAADDDFFVSRYADVLLNATFGSFGTEQDDELGPVYPLAAPGAFVEVRPSERWFVRTGVYTADAGEDEPSNLGFGWSLDRGGLFLGEVGTERLPYGLPGTYTLGAIGTTKSLKSFEGRGSARGAYGGYVMIDQALALDARGGTRVGAFLRVSLIGPSDRIVARWYADAGVDFWGLVPGRERDVLGLGVAFLEFAEEYVESQRSKGKNVSRRQINVELVYKAPITSWLTLAPDLQLFFDPHFSRQNAVVFGVRAVVEL